MDNQDQPSIPSNNDPNTQGSPQNNNQPSVMPTQQLPREPGGIVIGGQPVAPVGQINPSSQQATTTPTSLKPKGPSKLPVILILIVVVLVVGGGAYYLVMSHKSNKSTPSISSSSSYQGVVKEFITAMDNGDAQKVASLQSAAFASSNKSQTNHSNFYDACQSEGVICTYYFNKTYDLSTATVTTKAYTAKNKTAGKEVDYTVNSNSSSHTSGSSTLSSTSVTVFTFDIVPSGNTWLIDSVNVSTSASATVN